MFTIALVFCQFGLAVSLLLSSGVGPIGRIDISNIDKCAGFKSKSTLQLVKDANKRKVFNAEVDIDEDFTADWTYETIADKWSGSEYKMKIMEYSGKCCETFNKQVPELVKKIYADAKLSGNCRVKKGKYKFSVHALEKDIHIPALPYGKFKVTTKSFNPKKEMMSCFVIYAEHFQK